MKKRKILAAVLVLSILFTVLCAVPATVSAATTPTVAYRTHIQNKGWETSYKKNGQTSGTSGKSLRLEAIQIKIQNAPYSGGIQYQTHIQNKGWESGWKSNNQISGTSGKALRLEAIRIRLTGTLAQKYDVYYRVHAQNFGWLGWAKNGASAGSAGFSCRLEAIQIKLIPKGNSTAETRSTATAFRQTYAGSKTIRGSGSGYFDISGYGKTSPVSVRFSMGTTCRLNISINNKTVLSKTKTASWGRYVGYIGGVETTFLRLANRKVYVFVVLELDAEENTVAEACLYKYTGSKLVPEYDFLKDVAYPVSGSSGPDGAASFSSVSGNVVTFLSWGISQAVGYNHSYIKLGYQSGSMVPQSRVVNTLYNRSKYYQVRTNVPYYAGSTSSSAAGTLKAGTYCRINAMYFSNGVKRFQLIDRNGRSYWISASASYYNGPILAGTIIGQ